MGSYPITITAEVSHPTDYTKASTTTVLGTHTFVIYVQPCSVVNYSDTLKASEIRYMIGEPSLTAGSYTFDEDPFCGYPETVTLTDLTQFVAHNVRAIYGRGFLRSIL